MVTFQPFAYDLPAERIAQRPVSPPDAARLLVVREGSGFETCRFSDLPDVIPPGSVLVLNDTKVIPARLFGTRESGGDVELLLLRELVPRRWEALGKPMRSFRPGTVLSFGQDVRATIADRQGDRVIVDFSTISGTDEDLWRVGVMPIPPYIRKGRADDQDRADYQTVFAREAGSVAAPTASLHFTAPLLEKLVASGVLVRYVTLHVGAASFLPVFREDDSAENTGLTFRPPGKEQYRVSKDLVAELRILKGQGRPIVAVGTTVVRALESMALAAEEGEEGSLCDTQLMITPGFVFRMVDGLITNFHQPFSSHLLLVEAFLGRERLAAAYECAMSNEYRFLSYGDGMIATRVPNAPLRVEEEQGADGVVRGRE